MKITEFFKTNKGSWTLAAIFIVLLMAIVIYPEFWNGQDSDAVNAEKDDNLSSLNIADNQQHDSTNNSLIDDGEALPDDPDTTVDTDAEPDSTEANTEPPQWLFPLSGEIGRANGYSHDPTYDDYRFHHGIDITAEPGTAVYAAESGTVTLAREDGYWGGIVTIDHGNGWQSTYRCLEPAVSYGQELTGGDTIGYIKETTTAEGGQEAHLHFELYLNEEEVDPQEWL